MNCGRIREDPTDFSFSLEKCNQELSQCVFLVGYNSTNIISYFFFVNNISKLIVVA
jgi:hypothetical protein